MRIGSQRRRRQLNEEPIMIVRHRTWFFRLSGKGFAQGISFTIAVSAAMVREALRRTVGEPAELWGRPDS
jgi:hypothetical protein